MLVKVDDRHSIIVAGTRKLLRSRVAGINESKIREVGADEWQAGRYVIVESSSKNRVILVCDFSHNQPSKIPVEIEAVLDSRVQARL